MASVLELQSISKSFGKLQILNEIDLKLDSGDSVAIVGTSGAGKSTLLHVAGLMEPPTTGKIFLNGRLTSSMSDTLRSQQRLNTIGFLFQFHYLLPDLNVLENVIIPSRLAGEDVSGAMIEAKMLLDRLGLSNRLTHKPHQLSGGEQQRVGLARALIRRPKLLLCDEPTGNLDEHTAQSVSDLIFSEIHRDGVATIIVTHNEELAKKAGTTYHLSDGNFRKRRSS